MIEEVATHIQGCLKYKKRISISHGDIKLRNWGMYQEKGIIFLYVKKIHLLHGNKTTI
jgi:hypothetical protein